MHIAFSASSTVMAALNSINSGLKNILQEDNFTLSNPIEHLLIQSPNSEITSSIGFSSEDMKWLYSLDLACMSLADKLVTIRLKGMTIRRSLNRSLHTFGSTWRFWTLEHCNIQFNLDRPCLLLPLSQPLACSRHVQLQPSEKNQNTIVTNKYGSHNHLVFVKSALKDLVQPLWVSHILQQDKKTRSWNQLRIILIELKKQGQQQCYNFTLSTVRLSVLGEILFFLSETRKSTPLPVWDFPCLTAFIPNIKYLCMCYHLGFAIVLWHKHSNWSLPWGQGSYGRAMESSDAHGNGQIEGEEVRWAISADESSNNVSWPRLEATIGWN